MDNKEIMAGNMRVLMGKDVEDKANYTDDRYNYVAPGELTVTVTLGEYRNLVKSYMETNQLRTDNYKLHQEKDKLQEQLNACKKELTECKTNLKLFHQIREESRMPGEPTEEHIFVEDVGEN